MLSVACEMPFYGTGDCNMLSKKSGEESSMSFNGQARSTTWRQMLCSRCIPADLLPGSGLTVNIEILRVTNVVGTGTIAVDPELR